MSQLKQNTSKITITTQTEPATDKIIYTKEEHSIWEYLYKEQLENLQNKALPIFFECLNAYHLPQTHIPQIAEISAPLKQKTGWEVIRVEELIDSHAFFELLANKKFPSTVYIRKKLELHISRDPDIFHEMFGHVAMLMDPQHAHYMQLFGQLALTLDETELKLFQRLFWFTYEVGLIQTNTGLRIYGGSILSSLKESQYALRVKEVTRKPFTLLDIFRTPYRADQLQNIYYVIDDFNTLFDILDNREYLLEIMWQAYYLGEFPAQFPIDNSRYVSINCCQLVI